MRAVFISDLHLGTPGCQAEALLDFLKAHPCDHLYLLGDIIDGWQLRRRWFWPQTHNDVIQKILRQARKGTRVVYIPGNHDEMFRDYIGMTFGGVELLDEAIHETADGRLLLVTHGDMFDGVVFYARWLAFLGDQAYSLLLSFNRLFNAVRRRLKMPYWSLSSHVKKKVKNAVQYICAFEDVVAREAEHRHVDGVVCGHIHSAEIRQFGDVTYYNDGDWVESCTALVEDFQGDIAIIDWAAHVRKRAAMPADMQFA